MLGIFVGIVGVLGANHLLVQLFAGADEEYQRIKEEQQQRIQEKLATEKQFTQQEASSAVSK